MKRFSFEGIDKRQDFCASKNPRAGTTPAEAEADKSLTIVSESLQVVISETRSTGKTPSIIWSDNIDGCEPEKTFLTFSVDEDEDIIHLKSVDGMNEHIEKLTILNHEKEDAMISSQNGTPKVVRQGWLLRQNRKTKALPIQSRIFFVNRQTKVFKIFWVLRFLEKYSMKKTILQSIVILQTPLAANDTNQEFLAEIQVRLKKKWNCQTQGHLIPQYMRQILREHRKLHTTEMQRTFRLT